MQTLLLLLGKPLIEAAISAFGRVLLDFFRTWKASEDAKALGRAEAHRDATVIAAEAEREMGAVDLPERDDLLKKLREGLA
jgi:hypothetical protein